MTNKVPEPQDVRVEYTELSRYFVEVVKFRFVILSFYLAGGAVFVVQAKTRAQLGLFLLVTVFVWMLELRNRLLLRELGARGQQIESKLFHYPRGEGYYTQMFSGHRSVPPPEASASWQLAETPLFLSKIKLPTRVISHGFAIDCIFLTATLGSVLASFRIE